MASDKLLVYTQIASPASKGVLGLAGLDALERAQQLQAHGAGVGLGVGDKGDRLLAGGRGAEARGAGAGGGQGARGRGGDAARDGADGDEAGGGAGGEDLVKVGELGVFDLRASAAAT
ncbi:hypothetical protein VDGD_20532 [Verticillium dahliae]|nr:hypothetical protein VDGD_20532 [Verticillium dahliae]